MYWTLVVSYMHFSISLPPTPPPSTPLLYLIRLNVNIAMIFVCFNFVTSPQSLLSTIRLGMRALLIINLFLPPNLLAYSHPHHLFQPTTPLPIGMNHFITLLNKLPSHVHIIHKLYTVLILFSGNVATTLVSFHV